MNTLIKKWKNNEPTLNGWISLREPFAVEIMAKCGFDSLTIDMQHGISDYSDIVSMLIAMSTNDTYPMIRVPFLDPSYIMKALDAGALGVICPMINTADEAKKLVEYTHFAPQGKRSFGPIRAKFAHNDYYNQTKKNLILTIAMIETKEAIENLDAILGVDGIDGIYIGPADLSLSLGATPRFDPEEQTVTQAIEHIIAQAKKHNKYAGIHNGSVSYAKKMIGLGFNFVTVGSDANSIFSTSSQIVQDFKDTGDTKEANTGY